ncbi:hypothetical protein FB451DRAFT_1256985 [Mycena latifolia]|nr:hypothetical protein FB451DRAFT_1256985 [Mycena latifolia]
MSMAALIPDSPEALAPLLQSNDAPQPMEKALVQEILRRKEVELSALDVEISVLQSKLQTLQSSHADLASQMNLCQSILSPIRRLPPEIIGEIFLHLVPSLPPDGRHRRVEVPWKLGQICRVWRTIALSLDRLWSVLDLSFTHYIPPKCWAPRLVIVDEPSEEEDIKLSPHLEADNREYEEGFEIETTLEFIKGCVKRSGRRPLAIRLNARDHNYAVFPILEALFKRSARWGEIVLISPPQGLLNHLSRPEGNLQQLHKIVFANLSLPITHDADFYQRLPNLNDLSFVAGEIPQRSHSDIPWSQLTRYCEIDCAWTAPERWAAYRQLTNLVVLRLSLGWRYSSVPSTQMMQGKRISFPNLRVASFRFCYHSSSVDLIQFFTMPALEAFSIHTSSHGTYASQLHLVIPSSSPHLKILRICIRLARISDGDMERTLEMFPDLTELTLDTTHIISNRVVSRLTPHHDRPVLAPKLEIIRLSVLSFIPGDCKWKTLLEMLQARFKPTTEGFSALRTFEFRPNGRMTDENVAVGLKTLKERRHWDIKVGDDSWPEWDDLYLSTA